MKSVLITGTSKGIGYETALAFARQGFRVHATMRNPSQSPALAETAKAEKLPIAVSAMDVDDDRSVATAIADIQSQHGPVEILINNAGVERAGSIEEQSIDDFRATMETNYFGALRCIKAVGQRQLAVAPSGGTGCDTADRIPAGHERRRMG